MLTVHGAVVAISTEHGVTQAAAYEALEQVKAEQFDPDAEVSTSQLLRASALALMNKQ